MPRVHKGKAALRRQEGTAWLALALRGAGGERGKLESTNSKCNFHRTGCFSHLDQSQKKDTESPVRMRSALSAPSCRTAPPIPPFPVPVSSCPLECTAEVPQAKIQPLSDTGRPHGLPKTNSSSATLTVKEIYC